MHAFVAPVLIGPPWLDHAESFERRAKVVV